MQSHEEKTLERANEALRTRLRAAADAIAQAVEDELATHFSGERLLSLPEAGVVVGLHPATIRRRHREGRLPFPLVEVDGVLRARRSDLDAWIRGLPVRRILHDAVEPVRRPVGPRMLGRGIRRA